MGLRSHFSEMILLLISIRTRDASLKILIDTDCNCSLSLHQSPECCYKKSSGKDQAMLFILFPLFTVSAQVFSPQHFKVQKTILLSVSQSLQHSLSPSERTLTTKSLSTMQASTGLCHRAEGQNHGIVLFGRDL